MIYLFLIYIVFQVVYDQWLPDSPVWNPIYFGFQYGWIAALSILQALKGKHYLFYYIFALIMLIIALCEFLQIGQTASAHTSPGVSAFSLVILVFLLLFIKRWTGLKTTSSKQS